MMTAAIHSSLLNCRTRTLPKIRPVVNLRRCFSNNECEEEEPKNRIKLDEEAMAPMTKVKVFSSMWENPNCCIEPCENYRHDLLYLKKNPDRKYTRTWNECDDVVKERYVCVGDILPPERERRPRRVATVRGAKKTCVGEEFKLDLMKCIPPRKFDMSCPRMIMPGCKPVRKPPSCTKVTPPKCCQKRCTQYPAYSECDKPKPKVQRPIECKCLKVPSICEVYAMFRKFAVK